MNIYDCSALASSFGGLEQGQFDRFNGMARCGRSSIKTIHYFLPG